MRVFQIQDDWGLGNLRLAEKSPNFGYAEQGRRVFLSARLDF